MPTTKLRTVPRVVAVDGQRLPPGRKSNREHGREREYLTPEELDKLVTTARKRGRYGLRDALAITMGYRHGLRVSELCLGGIVKHVTAVERQWARFIVEGPVAMGRWDEAGRMQAWLDGFRMLPGETLAGLLDDYAAAARQTDDLVATLPDLDASQPLPEAPWYEPGARWSARHVLLHVIAETAQHAGHADIIREAIDGGKTMG